MTITMNAIVHELLKTSQKEGKLRAYLQAANEYAVVINASMQFPKWFCIIDPN